eukprot:TRINITY_DN6441_c0_g1_i3.p1 TRINITY_DN6441_c0_g1~~TRINITY_DN6441_c0_g1_i3.p1  ORF type:complete len:477 (-),score=102.90 TRINITY_DN6441_c0_g1_i3:199-1581(-)
MKLLCIFAIILVLTPLVLTGTKEEWKKRTIYHLLTDRYDRGDGDNTTCKELGKHCGGTFNGIKNNLKYIKNMGFDAILISPIPKNQGDDYHGYSFVDMYQINPHFGTTADLKALVAECKKEDIWVMIDVVANHVANTKEDFTKIMPFNKPKHYHKVCHIDPNRMWEERDKRENCRLNNMPDLNQTDIFVQTELKRWVKGIVEIYGFEGIRVSAAPYVPLAFWKEYAQAAGVFQLGDVAHENPKIVAEYQQAFDGMVNYPLYHGIQKVFKENSHMSTLKAVFDGIKKEFKDTTVLGTFLDNHDKRRFLHGDPDIKKFKNALTFVLMFEGIPIIYYGSEQGFNGGDDPQNRESLWDRRNKSSEMYQFMTKVVSFRKKAKLWQYSFEWLSADEDVLVFSRGNVIVALTNNKGTISKQVTVPPFFNMQLMRNVFNKDDVIRPLYESVDIVLTGGDPKIYEMIPG